MDNQKFLISKKAIWPIFGVVILGGLVIAAWQLAGQNGVFKKGPAATNTDQQQVKNGWQTVDQKDMGIILAFDPAAMTMTEDESWEIFKQHNIILESKEQFTYNPPDGSRSSSLPLMQITITVPLSTENFLKSLPWQQDPGTPTMTWERYDLGGFVGYKQWTWRLDGGVPVSDYFYRFHLGDRLLNIEAAIHAASPDSTEQQKAEKLLTNIVNSLKVKNAAEVETSSFPRTVEARIAANTIPTYAAQWVAAKKQIVSPAEPKDWTAVNNQTFGLAFSYDNKIFDLTDHTDCLDENFCDPEIMLTSKELRNLDGYTKELVSISLRVSSSDENKNALKSLIEYPRELPLTREMIWSRYDLQGFYGYRELRWMVENYRGIAVVSYVFYLDDKVLTIRAEISATNPESKDFIQGEKYIDQVVETLRFNGSTDKTEVIRFTRSVKPKISANSINQTRPGI